MTPSTIALGFEVGTGDAVAIPLKHMAVTGQSQEAGKTTALEALLARAAVRAVTFITKRGEGSFAEGRRLPPFFRERADWVFVASLIDATLGEKNKLLRAWLMKVCRNTKTLAEVQVNVKAAQAAARGFAESIYTEIDGYLDLVVPQLAQLPPVRAVQIGPGLNVMDLSPYSSELQALVIRSVLEHVYEHEHDVVTVIPEAWEFLPEHRGSPVKLAAEMLIRKGAALRNYMWIDSQDLAGVWKLAIRACPIVLVGVQREANEIKRTLANIPAGVAKPSAANIAELELGQFYACWGRHAVKTYVQPAWMPSWEAQHVACGGDVREVASIHKPITAPRQAPQEEDVNAAEAKALTSENTRLKTALEHATEQIAALERRIDALAGRPSDRPAPDPARTDRAAAEVPAPAARTRITRQVLVPDEEGVDDAFYQSLKARLIEDGPALLKLALGRPEIEVTVTRKTLTLDENSLKGRIARLLKDGFFAEARGCGAVRSALKRTGPDANTANIGRALDDFTKDGFVTDEGSGYRAVPDMIVRILEG